jgi:ankyrin repeat protein
MVSYLLGHPCIDPNSTNGATPLHTATERDSEMLRLLLSDSRVDVTPLDVDGQQPIHWAVDYGKLVSLKNSPGCPENRSVG